MQRKELLIIMTPHVVRSAGDIEQLKQAEFARMSWCEADVFAMHGDVYPTTNLSTPLVDGMDCHVVYPDVDPRGLPPSTIDEAYPYSTEGFSTEPIPAAPSAQPGRSSVVPAPSGRSGGTPKRPSGPLATLDLPTVPQSLGSQFNSAAPVVTASASSPIATSSNGTGTTTPQAFTSPPAESQRTLGGAR